MCRVELATLELGDIWDNNPRILKLLDGMRYLPGTRGVEIVHTGLYTPTEVQLQEQDCAHTVPGIVGPGQMRPPLVFAEDSLDTPETRGAA